MSEEVEDYPTPRGGPPLKVRMALLAVIFYVGFILMGVIVNFTKVSPLVEIPLSLMGIAYLIGAIYFSGKASIAVVGDMMGGRDA